DILMNRVAHLERQSCPSLNRPPLWIGISDCVAEGEVKATKDGFLPVDDAIQRTLKEVRTDLNQFSFAEINSLVEHGYEVAMKMFTTSSNRPTLKLCPWTPCPEGWPGTIESSELARLTIEAREAFYRVKRSIAETKELERIDAEVREHRRKFQVQQRRRREKL